MPQDISIGSKFHKTRTSNVTTSTFTASYNVDRGSDVGTGRGFLGVIVEPVLAKIGNEFGLTAGGGAVIVRVLEDGPAERAGLTPGEVIVAVGDEIVRSENDFAKLEAALASEVLAPIKVLRAIDEEAVVDVLTVDKALYPPSRTYLSRLGFNVTLPAGWNVTTAAETKTGVEYVSNQAGVNAGIVLGHLKRIAGHMEIFAKSTDVVTVVRESIPLPRDPVQARQKCASIAASRSKTTAREIQCVYRQGVLRIVSNQLFVTITS